MPDHRLHQGCYQFIPWGCSKWPLIDCLRTYQKRSWKYVNTTEIIGKVTMTLSLIWIRLINSNNDFNFVGWLRVIKTPCLFYFRCVKFHYIKETYTWYYHRFRWYATLENKTPAQTFPKFPSILRVIDRSDRNPPITATSVTFWPSLRHASGLWLMDVDPTCR